MPLLLRRFHLAGALYLLALLCAIAGSKYLQVDGSTIVVTSTADSGPGSLRQAFADANDADTIQFDPTLNGQTITLTSAELAIDKNVTITGPGPGLLTVSRNQQAPNFRIFHTLPGHTVVISGLTISGGRVGVDGGAGIMNDQASLTINNCTISANILAGSQSDGGGGGGIRNRGGILNLVNSTVSANEVRFGAGGHLVNGGGVASSGALTVTNITNSVISGNSSDFNGGGIVNDSRLTIIDSVISGNHTGSFISHTTGLGGGIFSGGSGILVIRNSVVSANTASGDSTSGIGGGICSQWSLAISDSTISGNSATRVGGGIYGYATITNCTISGNFTQGPGGGIFGGGIITNCTISGNTASQGPGGGIYGGGNITNSTIAGNSANQGGSIYATNEVQLGQTILKAGSSGANIVNNGGSVTSLGYNLSSDNGGAFLIAPGDQINTDPLLGPLQDNGGPAFTHIPLNGSPAIDAGNPNFTPPPLNDQRGYGYARVFNGRIDIGSLEVQPAPTLSPTPTATATATFAPSATPCSPLLTQSRTQTITTGNSVSCNNGNGNSDNSYWRAFDMAALTGGASYDVNSVSFGVESVTHPVSVTVRLYTTSNFPTGVLNQIGTTSLNVSSADNGTVVTAPLLANVPAGTAQLVMELFTPDGAATGTLFYVGSNADPETAPSYLSTAVCGLTTPAPLAAIGFPDMHIVLNIHGNCGALPSATPTATPTATATVSPSPSPTPAAQPLNLSTRMRVLTDAKVGIGGFIITGSVPKTVLLRGIGPSLGSSGVPDPLADPVMELHGSAGFTTLTNDNWKETQEKAIGATGLAPANDLESAILATLDPGNYTAIVMGKNNGVGVGLVEAYDLDQAAGSKLANISTRAFCGTADNVIIAGFILGGGNHAHIFIHAGGPFGINPALADATLELRDGSGALLASNDDCESSIIGPPNPADACIDITLPPGPYTAILAGKNGGTGVGLVEIYNVN